MTSLPTPVKRRLDVACRPCPVRSATPLTEELLLYRFSAMASLRRPSAQTTAVVLALADEPATWRYGYELCQHLGLKAGSCHPSRMRLPARGLLEPAGEPAPPAGRPPRHLYRLTGPGRALAG